jgi:hypothetical protein
MVQIKRVLCCDLQPRPMVQTNRGIAELRSVTLAGETTPTVTTAGLGPTPKYSLSCSIWYPRPEGYLGGIIIFSGKSARVQRAARTAGGNLPSGSTIATCSRSWRQVELGHSGFVAACSRHC